MPILTGHSKQFILDLVLGFVATPTGPADFAETVWRVLQHGAILMASTTFSGPVTSTAGFVGAVTGNVTGNVTGGVDATTAYVQIHTVSDTELADATDDVNTVGKAAGTIAFETTNSYLYIATGALATDTWVLADGTGAVTPS
jgi:hypothetical protein